MAYRFELECPRCGKSSEYVSDSYKTCHVNCGDCLMDETEVVELKIISLEVVEEEQP